jgi:hypothetical protein
VPSYTHCRPTYICRLLRGSELHFSFRVVMGLTLGLATVLPLPTQPARTLAISTLRAVSCETPFG